MTALVLAATVATATAANYQWRGLSADLSDPRFYDGITPFGANHPGSLALGSANRNTIAVAPAGITLKAGRKLEFEGDGKIFLGNGIGRTNIQFDSSASGLTARFAPANMDAGNINSSGIAYNCNRNWRLANGDIPSRPPCDRDAVTITPGQGEAFFISTFDSPAGAASIRSGSDTVNSCDLSNPDTISFDNTAVSIDVGSCSFKFKFPGTNPRQFEECPMPQCPGVIISTNADGDEVQMINDGPDAGTVLVVQDDGTVRPDSMTPVPGPGGTTTWIYSNISLSPDGTVAAPSTGGSDDSDGSGSIIIIIVVVAVLVILAIIAVVVVVVKKQGASAGATRDAGIVSFENPMYDDVDQSGGANENYDEPEMTGTSGYMDVPAGEESGFGGGYMDVNPGEQGGASGYMDVAPEADDSDDGDI